MPHIAIRLLIFVVLVSCKNTIEKNTIQSSAKKDSIISFCIIRKDSINQSSYRFEKTPLPSNVLSYKYINEKDKFSIFWDTTRNIYRGKFDENDTVIFDVREVKYYTINGNDVKVQKLVGNKNVTDGSFSVFFSPAFGVLLTNSDTWRAARFMCVDQSDKKYIEITGLLYRIQSDEDFFSKSNSNNDKKMKPPKFE
jgi:hypothetical protein